MIRADDHLKNVMNQESIKKNDDFSDIQGYDVNGNIVNIFDIPTHNNMFSHLKVYDCCCNNNNNNFDDNKIIVLSHIISQH